MAEPESVEMSAEQDLSGTTVGRFAIRVRLGVGGMGEVYRADDTRLKRPVALKRMAPELRADEHFRRRFLREAVRASALNDPHIASIYDVFESDGETFLVMEYVEGETLRERLGPPLDPAEFLSVACQCAEALKAAHARDIVHRDIKPENIMVSATGQVKILDFGIAQRLRAGGIAATLDTLETATGLSGTPAYMAPEVLLEKDTDARADIFSLGVVFYEALAGQHPFRAVGFVETVDQILHQGPASLRAASPRVTEALERIVLRMLAKNPAERYASATELLADLRALEREPTLSAAALPTPAPPASRSRTRALALKGVAALVLLLAAAVAFDVGGLRRRLFGGPARIESLAVLPLRNISGNPAEDYFAEGMTEALITSLSKAGPLRVISRTSVMRYAGRDVPLPQIARELGVDAVVGGSVQRAGARVRISAQLTDARSEKNLWAESYERDFTDVLSLQSEIARAIVAGIELQLTPDEESRLRHARPVNPEAYEAYLRGRYHWSKRTRENLLKARDYFQQAIEKDPTYAPAYAGLADSFQTLGTYAFLPPLEAYPLAQAAARKALELDNTLGEAHAALAATKLFGLELVGAEEGFRRAIALNPNYANAHHWYAHYLAAVGRHEEALSEIQTARRLDPLSPILNANVGWFYYLARRYDEAIAVARQTLELDPDFPVAHEYLGQAYLEKGQVKEALVELQRAIDLSGGSPSYRADLGNAYGVAGRRREALHVLDELTRLSQERYVGPYDFAFVHTGLGNRREALDYLEKAYQERSGRLGNLNVHPRFDALRSEPRFQALVRQMGLEPAAAR